MTNHDNLIRQHRSWMHKQLESWLLSSIHSFFPFMTEFYETPKDAFLVSNAKMNPKLSDVYASKWSFSTSHTIRNQKKIETQTFNIEK